MIRSDKEYRVARTRLDETKQAIVQQRIEYAEMGLDIATANMFIGSTLAQQQQIQDEIVEYENARAFKLDDYSFKALDRFLVGLRLACGLSVVEFAKTLGYSDASTVSRDENNGYRGITKERLDHIFDTLGVEVKIAAAPKMAAEGHRPINVRSDHAPYTSSAANQLIEAVLQVQNAMLGIGNTIQVSSNVLQAATVPRPDAGGVSVHVEGAASISKPLITAPSSSPSTATLHQLVAA